MQAFAKLATEYFENINADSEGKFTGSFGILMNASGFYDDDGKLVVDVVQLKGDDLGELLSKDGGREIAMESRKRWSGFLGSSHWI